jgi:hypothetical protein
MGEMRFRNLRIAWSVLWGLAAVLLIVLWARSYWCGHKIVGQLTTTEAFILESRLGRIEVTIVELPYGSFRSVPFSIIAHGPQRSFGDTVIGFDAPETVGGFFFGRSGGFRWVIVPYRFVLLLASVLAAIPWIPRRFTLRTLLIATTLVALALGLIVWAAE